MAMELGLDGKIAVITGGSVGVGLAVAEGLAAEGVNLLLVARGRERLEQETARIAGEEPLIHTIGHRAWLKSQWREATVCRIMTERL